MYVPVAEDGEPFYSQGVPVRFYRSDGTDWVANVYPGCTTLTQIIELKNTPNLLVIASGTCYLMNADDTKPISAFGAAYCDIFRASNDRLVLQDQTELTIVEANGTWWNTVRISWDGLAEIRVDNNVVSGLAYDPMEDTDEWIPFTYDLDTKTLAGGSYYRPESTKPWWKIW